MSSMHATTIPLTRKAGGMRRRLFLSLGLTCVALGLVGIVVPGLPTTVFLLAASWLFARSSPRFHDWLLSSARLGPYLRMAQGGAVMPARAVVVSLVSMWAGISFAALGPMADAPILQAGLVGLGAAGSAAIGWAAWRSRRGGRSESQRTLSR